MAGIKVAALCAGKGAVLPSGKLSGIGKTAIAGPVMITDRGIAADEQINRTYHGYPAMALHHFPHDHYEWLRTDFAAPPRLRDRGSMGENISTDGLLELQVHIGDRFRLGSALIEITQPRQPCATIEAQLERKGVVAAIIRRAQSGWFYRVLEPGQARAGDMLHQVETGHTDWTVERAFRCVYSKPRGTQEELRELAALPRVSDRLVRDIEKQLNQ